MAEKDLVREADQALARASRNLAQARKALEDEIKQEMLGVVLTPGLRKDDPVAETDTEAGYAKRLEGALRADLAKMAGTKL